MNKKKLCDRKSKHIIVRVDGITMKNIRRLAICYTEGNVSKLILKAISKIRGTK